MGERLRLSENPFHVLGLQTTASQQEIERAAQRWLAELSIGRERSRTYGTPLGVMPRTPELVRVAAAELRDPTRRLMYEIWAEVPCATLEESQGDALPWSVALRVLRARATSSARFVPRALFDVVARLEGCSPHRHESTRTSERVPSAVPWGRWGAISLLPVLVPSLLHAHSMPAIVLLALGTILAGCVALPWPVTYLVLVPCGMVKTTWALHALSGGSLDAFEMPASKVCPAALALLQRPSDASAVFVERRLARCFSLGASGLAAYALLACARGDRESARSFFEMVEGFAEGRAPPSLVELASDFLALDAASRGDFPRVAALARQAAQGPILRFLALVAPALVGENRPPPSVIGLAWALAPARRELRPLLERALAPPKIRVPAEPTADLRGFAALLRLPAGEVRRDDVHSAVASIDAMRFAGGRHARFFRRARSLAPGLDYVAVLQTVMSDAARDIAALMVSARLPLAWLPSSMIGDDIRKSVREERLVRLEALVGEIKRRNKLTIDLPEIEEWRTYGDLRRAIEDVLEGARTAAEHRMVFQTVERPLTLLAARLCDVRWIRVLAREILRGVVYVGYFALASEGVARARNNLRVCAKDRQSPDPQLPGEFLTSIDRRTALRSRTNVAIVCSALLSGAILRLGDSLSQPLKGVFEFLAIAIFLGSSVGAFVLEKLRVDVALSPGSLVIQNGNGRYVALRTDVRSPRVYPGGILGFSLSRAPHWLPKRLWTCTVSREHAVECAKRITAIGPGVAQSTAPGVATG